MRVSSNKKIIITLLLALNLFLIWRLFLVEKHTIVQGDYPELTQIHGNESFSQLSEYFKDLAIKKGAVYAYEVLKIIPVAPGTDMHLMGHVVGEMLYKQKGASGMQYCTQDFRNACSHTIVVGLFSEKGTKALGEIIDECERAPGGKGAYNMCFHGLGHGVLSYSGYDMAQAVNLCSKIKKSSESGREFPECVGGTVMEIISGGDHDKESWRPQNKKYMGTSDPLYPCNSSIIPDEAKELCYTYLTPHLIEFKGGNFGLPTDKDITKAFTYCMELPENDHNRNVCLSGFGKEFVVLARQRDIRNVEAMTVNEMLQISKWCSLAQDSEGNKGCIESALNSIYWGGENRRETAIKFCNSINEDTQNACFTRLISNVAYFIDDNLYKKEFCAEIPKKYLTECKEINEI